MMEINIDPYGKLENKNYNEDFIINIGATAFTGTSHKEGRMVYAVNECRFKKIIIKNTEEILFKDIPISFTNCFIERLEVDSIETKNISLHFHATILSGVIKSKNLQTTQLNNCIPLDGIFLMNQDYINISYTEENIFPKKWKSLLKGSGITSIELIKMKQSYYIHDSKKIVFTSNQSDYKLPGFYIRDYEQIKNLKLAYCLTREQKSLLDIHVSIQYNSEVTPSETKISDSLLSALSLSGAANGIITVENTKINHWYVHDFSVTGEGNFYNISPLTSNETKIEFHKSNLEKTWFDGIDFRKYNIVSFFRTKFGKATFSSCDFPSNYTSFEIFSNLENVHYPERRSDSYYKNQYEIFLQLKLLMEARGNFYESQKLQAISNDALQKIGDVSNWDKFILWVSSKSNNHGLSISRPLGYFLLFTIILYLLYLNNLGFLFNGGEFDPKLIGYYFPFIDPTHRNDFLVEKEELTGWSLALDYLNKIIVGFLIYQFISAFRKYGKK